MRISKTIKVAIAVVVAAAAVAFLIGPKPDERATTSEAVVAESGAETLEIEDPIHDRPFTASQWASSGTDRNALVVFSHGFSGDRTAHDDLAVALAADGYTVVAPTHPDLAGLESADPRLDPLTLRPRHLSLAIDEMAERNGADFDDVIVVGHSLGGYSAMRLAGAMPTEVNGLDVHCEQNPSDVVLCTERARSRFSAIIAQQQDLTDSRVSKVVLLAPGYGPLFSAEGLTVSAPVLVVAATDDGELAGDQVNDLISMLPATTESLSVEGGHYVFLRPCTADEASGFPEICEDSPGVSRAEVHSELLEGDLLPFMS